MEIELKRPELEDRLNHHLTRAYLGAETDLPGSVRAEKNGFAFVRNDLTLRFDLPGADWHTQGEWHYMGYLPFEENYGQDHLTDRYSPGYFQVPLRPGERAVLSAVLASENAVFPAEESPEAEKSIASLLPEALEQFIVRRDDLKSVIAGFPWFLDWGRDTLIFLRGLLVYREFLPQCREILLEFAGFEKDGLIPNVIRGNDVSNRDTSDAPLYLILGFRDYIVRSGDEAILDVPVPGHKNVREALISIVEHYRSGTPNGIVMDKASALIYSPAHFSWMDTNFPAGTPRSGYPGEIQALWFSALEFLGYHSLAKQVKESINRCYFLHDKLSDCLHAERGVPAHLAQPDDHLRPNILWAITLKAVDDHTVCQRILEAVRQLLVPGGIRTLDDVRVEYPLEIRLNGELLNDPHHPYMGKYRGPENTSRKPAYHNGTVWLWPFPSYCEALYLAGGEKERKKALDLLLGMKKYWESGAVGQLPEVADGDAPHCAGGCAAQAWSISEFARVYALLG